MSRRLASALLALLIGCGDGAGDGGGDGSGDDSGDGSGDGDGDGSGDGDGGAPDAAPSAACEGLSPPAVLSSEWTLEHAGVTRTFRVHIPPGYDPAVPTPLVFDFHGLTMTSDLEDYMSGMRAAADAHGFIAVQAQGLDNSWNAGNCCGESGTSGVDDVGFVVAMLDRLEAELCVDEKRVYTMGLSNGGFLSHRLGCELADRFAAFASVAGRLSLAACAPARPIPALQFHGTSDGIVSFAGVPEMMQAWAARNGCDATSTEIFAMGDTRCEQWNGCDGGAEVVFCTVDGGGHTWPGGPDVAGLGKTTQAIDATAYAWQFFQRHALP